MWLYVYLLEVEVFNLALIVAGSQHRCGTAPNLYHTCTA